MRAKLAAIRIVNETGVSNDTKVLIADTGQELRGVSRVCILPIKARGGPVEAILQVYAEVDVLSSGECTLIPGYVKAVGEFRLP